MSAKPFDPRFAELFLELQIRSADSTDYLGQTLCPHGDTCRVCQLRRLSASVAAELYEKKEFGPDTLIKWAEEFERRRKQLPSAN